MVVAAISYLSLVLGELVPKSLALRVGETYALLIARPLRWLSAAANPLVVLLTATSNLILKPFRDRTNFMEARLSREELQQLVDEAAKTGTVDQHAGEIASRAIAFDQLTLADVVIPRDHIDALPRKATAGADPPLHARGAALAHPGLRRAARQPGRLRQRQGHHLDRLGGQAGRAGGPAAPAEDVRRDHAGDRRAALDAPRAASHRRSRSTSTAASRAW